MKRIGAIMIAAVLVLTGCGKEVDKEAVDAKLVRGTSHLYWFCDENGTLIYFEDFTGSDDQFEAMWYGVCVNGKPAQILENPNTNNGGANG